MPTFANGKLHVPRASLLCFPSSALWSWHTLPCLLHDDTLLLKNGQLNLHVDPINHQAQQSDIFNEKHLSFLQLDLQGMC
jgi:hypothetical protein